MKEYRKTLFEQMILPQGWIQAQIENRIFGHEQMFGIPATPPAKEYDLYKDICTGEIILKYEP